MPEAKQPWICRGWFIVSGFDCSPAAIGDVLGIAASRSGRIGKMRSGSVEDQRPVTWRLKSPLPEDVEPAVHLEWLLDHLPSRLDGLSSITKHWTGGFSFAIHVIRRGSTTVAPP